MNEVHPRLCGREFTKIGFMRELVRSEICNGELPGDAPWVPDVGVIVGLLCLRMIVRYKLKPLPFLPCKSDPIARSQSCEKPQTLVATNCFIFTLQKVVEFSITERRLRC